MSAIKMLMEQEALEPSPVFIRTQYKTYKDSFINAWGVHVSRKETAYYERPDVVYGLIRKTKIINGEEKDADDVGLVSFPLDHKWAWTVIEDRLALKPGHVFWHLTKAEYETYLEMKMYDAVDMMDYVLHIYVPD